MIKKIEPEVGDTFQSVLQDVVYALNQIIEVINGLKK